MGKTKLYELAKEMDIPSKELLEKAKAIGIDLKSHLSVISDEDISKIRGVYKNSGKSEEKKESNKKDNKSEKKPKKENETKKDNPVIIRREVIIQDETKKEDTKEEKKIEIKILLYKEIKTKIII